MGNTKKQALAVVEKRQRGAEAKPGSALERTTAKTVPEQFLPEDWDFRMVREDQLDAAILYEYARSSRRVIEVFQKWHRKKFRCRKKNLALATWDEQTVDALLSVPPRGSA
jgi:hypothetical protein